MRKMIATRDAYGAALKELGEQNTKVVDLEADVASSTKNGIFKKTFPERYFNVSTSELNMVPMAVGFARKGMIPYMNTFAVFMITKDADPVQSLVAYDGLNAKPCGTCCDLPDSYDGVSHRVITDLTSIRAIPNMTVIVAADGAETRKAVLAVAEHDGPVYLRLSRAKALVYYLDDMDFQIGRGITVREGGDVTIITMRAIPHKVLETVDLLVQEGISVTVVDTHTTKLIGRGLVIQCAIRAGAIATVEEHSIYGGLGGVMAEVLMENKPVSMKRIGAVDFTESGDYGELLVKYGHSPQAITDKRRTVIRRK